MQSCLVFFFSDTGTLPPESCVFGQLLNIGAVFGILLIDLFIVIYQDQSVNENHVVF